MNSGIKRALVVDDNVALARVIQFALDGAGFETQTAYNGRQALDAALQTQFDIVVTDHQMPEMTGVELCRELRSRPEYAHRPLVLLTAKGLELELPRLRDELGIDATFPKPFSPSALAKEVVELVANSADARCGYTAELVTQ
jgi:two-component system alkaline phosphatase synthesis response regulator PhoP